MRLPLTLCVLLIGLANCASNSDIVTPDDLANQLASIQAKSPMPGFAASVVKNGQIAFQKSFGQADVATNTPYTNQTTQPIGSVSKLMIGLALMKTVEQGLLTLNTDINTLLPFRVVNPNAPNVPIRVRHLVTHTSGILDTPTTYLGLYSILPGENLTTVEARRMISELKATTDGQPLPLSQLMPAYLTPGGKLYSAANFGKTTPGSTYAYSNLAASLAAYLVEIVTKTPFDVYTKTQIIDPLGMKSTAWSGANLPRSQMATLYWTKAKPLPRYTHASYPDGLLNTSNEDLGRFLQAMMAAYAGKPGILTKASFEQLFAKQFQTAPANLNAKEDNYGVFWVWFKNGRIGHTGGDLGVTTVFAFYPDKQTGFCFMANVDSEEGDDSYAISESEQAVFTAIKSFEAAP